MTTTEGLVANEHYVQPELFEFASGAYSSEGLRMEVALLDKQKEKTDKDDFLRRNEVKDRHARGRLAEASGLFPTKEVTAVLRSERTALGSPEVIWSLRETLGPSNEGLKITRNLRLSLDSGSLYGRSTVEKPMPNNPGESRSLRRQIDLRLIEEEGHWYTGTISNVVAEWEQRTEDPRYQTSNSHNHLYLRVGGDGEYGLIAKFELERYHRALKGALDSSSEFWETPEGKPTEDAKRLKGLFGVGPELFDEFLFTDNPAPQFRALVANIWAAEEPSEIPY